MGFYCLTMFDIVFELASQQPNENDAFEKLAIQFLEQFTHILKAMNKIGGLKINKYGTKRMVSTMTF